MPGDAARSLFDYLLELGEDEGELQPDGGVRLKLSQHAIARKLHRSPGTINRHLRDLGPAVERGHRELTLRPAHFGRTKTRRLVTSYGERREASMEPESPRSPTPATTGVPSEAMDRPGVIRVLAQWIAAHPADPATEQCALALAGLARHHALTGNEPTIADVIDLPVARSVARPLRDEMRDSVRETSRKDKRPDKRPDHDSVTPCSSPVKDEPSSGLFSTSPVAREDLAGVARDDHDPGSREVPAGCDWAYEDFDAWKHRLGIAAAAAGLPPSAQRPWWDGGLVNCLTSYTKAQIEHAVFRIETQLARPDTRITTPFGLLASRAKEGDIDYFPVEPLTADDLPLSPWVGSTAAEGPAEVTTPPPPQHDEPPPYPDPPEWAMVEAQNLSDQERRCLDERLRQIFPYLNDPDRWPRAVALFRWVTERARLIEADYIAEGLLES